MDNEFLQKVEAFVSNYYKENDNRKLVYHDLSHTMDVVRDVELIGLESSITDPELELLIIAAWFHDTGYLVNRDNHENASVEISTSFLTDNNYPADKIKKVNSLILSTDISHSPEDKLEEIIRDADLLHVGKKTFFEKSEWLKLEQEKEGDTTISPKEWNEKSLKFISEHKFNTQYAYENYNKKKLENINKLYDQRKKIEFKIESENFKEEKLYFEKQKLKEKKVASRKADRGIETMFRNVIRTHVEFSGMADSKANIMISVNTLILTAIAAVLASKLDSNPHLIIPTAVLSIASLTTLVFAIIVTRPKITSGVFTEDDIKKKKANLLFFGNFYKMKLDEFSWGMKEMMNDKEYLYGIMTMDFYYLGQVLGRKYKYLNICYTIFLVGMIISVIVFGIAILLTPEPTSIGSIID